MKVVFVRHGEAAQVKTVSVELVSLQRYFKNKIKVHYITSDMIAVVFDEHIRIMTGEENDKLVITGDAIICGFYKSKFCSLTKAQQDKYLNQFSKK